MKKIIIAICGIILAGGAMGADNRIYNTPIQVTNEAIINSWNMAQAQKFVDDAMNIFLSKKAGSSNDFIKTKFGIDNNLLTDVMSFIDEGDVKGVFAPNWQFNTKAGTYGDNNEGSITPIIAHEIYEHGGSFCMTQMQASFGKNTGKFIDYFNDNTGNNRYKCLTICEDGYSGDGCSENKYDCYTKTNYKTDLNNREDDSLRLRSGYNKGQIKPEVFAYKNGENNTNNSFAMVLGLLSIKEHSVIASPVYVTSDKKTITGAYSNKERNRLLCAPGYTPNGDNSDCKLSSYCEQVAELCSGEDLNLFDERKNHEWGTKTDDKGKTCKYIICKSGYGLKGGTESKECEKCETTRTQGVNSDGVCEQCENGKMFKEGYGCKDYTTYSIQELKKGVQNLFDCWKETGTTNYKECVKCGGNKTWHEDIKQCI